MRRGFTLIEVMIVIAILAIVAAVPLTALHNVRSLQRETDAALALRSLDAHLASLHAAPFSSLSPVRCKVGPGGWVTPGPRYLAEVRGAVAVEGSRARLKAPAGTTAEVSFSYYLPEVGELHVVNSRHVTLLNAPVLHVERVQLAQGERMVPVSGWKWTSEGLELPPSCEGKVVSVDYLGGRVRALVRSEVPSLPGNVRLLTLEEGQFGDQKVTVQVLRTAP